jgi:hypothetical protein
LVQLSDLGEIVIMGLDSREDRWRRCEEIIEANGIDRVTRYVTEMREPKWEHASRDFLDLLRLKRFNDLVFFEDDFELVNGWREVVERAYADLPEKWDMMYLGCNLRRAPLKVTANLYRVRGAWMLHAVIMSQRFIEYILKHYNAKIYPAFDEWCRQIAPEREFFMTYPMVAYQREGFSDYMGQYTKYDIFNNQYYLKCE